MTRQGRRWTSRRVAARAQKSVSRKIQQIIILLTIIILLVVLPLHVNCRPQQSDSEEEMQTTKKPKISQYMHIQ